MNSLQTLGINELQNGPAIFQLSRAGFFTYKCKSLHENEGNGVKLQFDSLLILMFHSPMITLPAESLWSSLKSQKRRSDSADIFKVLWFTDHPAIWMSQTSLMLDKSVFFHVYCILNPYSITKQMAATSISRSGFEKIIDSTFSKPWWSASPVFRKIRRCTPIWDGFCFGFNHVLSQFDLREWIHEPVSVLRCAFNSVLLWNWRILNKNI